MASSIQKLGTRVLFLGMALALTAVNAPLGVSQAAITGQITSHPSVITAGVDFTITATSNARRVRFEIQRNGSRVWYNSEYPDASGNVSFTDRLSSFTPSMSATLVLMDYDTRVVLDQKAVSIVAKGGSSSSSSSSSASSSSSLSSSSSSSSSSSQSAITGTITSFPGVIRAGVDFTVTATSNAGRVRFELRRGATRLWNSISKVPNASGNVSITDRTSSFTDPGSALLVLLDYSTKKILDQETVQIIPKNGSSSSSSTASSSSSSSSSVSSSSSSSSSSSVSSPAPTPVEFLLPNFPQDNRVMEGDWVRAEVKNGVGFSAFTIDVLYDGQTVYTHPFAETNIDGAASVLFQMPYKTLKDGHHEDGLVIQLNHADINFWYPFTLTQGLDVNVPSEIKEDTFFTYEVLRSTGETAVKAGIVYDAGPDYEFPMQQTDGSGNASITVLMPRLIQNGATRDGAEFWVETRDVRWYFPFTIVKGDPLTTVKALPKKITGQGGGTIYPAPVSAPPPSFASLEKADTTSANTSVPNLFERSKNTLVIIIYGSNQVFDNGSGMDSVYRDLKVDLQNVLRLESGINWIGLGTSVIPQWDNIALATYANQMALNKNAIRTVLSARPEIRSVVLVGYSWGGTAAYDLSYWLKTDYPTMRIIGTGYVDAIYFPYAGPLTRTHPLSESALNIYQGRFDTGLINGGPLDSGLFSIQTVKFSSILGKYFQQDIDAWSNVAKHTTIHNSKFVITVLEHYVKTVINQAFPN